MTASPYSCILWDVDGTIADASRGIMTRLTETLTALGAPLPPGTDLSPWIGPPLYESFEHLAGLSPERAEDAVTYYRELAARDGYAASVDLYPGVAELVHEARSAGIPQSTASTKPENQVIAILEHFELAPSFTAVSGARPGPVGKLDGKAFVIARALERLVAAGADVSRPVLIGDRHHDIEGGAEHGIPVIFADWGFGADEESAGAIQRVATADELRELILAPGTVGAGSVDGPASTRPAARSEESR